MLRSFAGSQIALSMVERIALSVVRKRAGERSRVAARRGLAHPSSTVSRATHTRGEVSYEPLRKAGIWK